MEIMNKMSPQRCVHSAFMRTELFYVKDLKEKKKENPVG